MSNQYLPVNNITPNSLIITGITQALPMVITCTLDNFTPNPRVNTYFVGMNVQITVPRPYGMFQANGLIGRIMAIDGNSFTMNIDSTLFDAFVIPVTVTESPPSIAPFGSNNLEYNNYTNSVPFKSLNNIGN